MPPALCVARQMRKSHLQICNGLSDAAVRRALELLAAAACWRNQTRADFGEIGLHSSCACRFRRNRPTLIMRLPISEKSAYSLESFAAG